eukprot:gene27765-36591_t
MSALSSKDPLQLQPSTPDALPILPMLPYFSNSSPRNSPLTIRRRWAEYSQFYHNNSNKPRTLSNVPIIITIACLHPITAAPIPNNRKYEQTTPTNAKLADPNFDQNTLPPAKKTNSNMDRNTRLLTNIARTHDDELLTLLRRRHISPDALENSLPPFAMKLLAMMAYYHGYIPKPSCPVVWSLTLRVYDVSITDRRLVVQGLQLIKTKIVTTLHADDLSELRDPMHDYDIIYVRLQAPKLPGDSYSMLSEIHRDLHAPLCTSEQPTTPELQKTTYFSQALLNDYAGTKAVELFVNAHPTAAARNFNDIVALPVRSRTVEDQPTGPR